MRKILGVARYTFTEIFRNRVYYVLLLFAGTLIAASFLLASLAGEQRARMITDLGLAAIEMVALIIAVFAAVTLVLEEMESRTLYLILTRPVDRFQFILGRFIGLIGIITLAFALMAAAHVLVLFLQNTRVDIHYLLALIFSWEKILVITAVALVFSLFSTSTLSGVSFTFFFWIMGHFSAEIEFLAKKASNPILTAFCNLFYYVAPNFSAMNLLDLSHNHTHGAWLISSAGYGVSYSLVCLALAVFLFRRKEF